MSVGVLLNQANQENIVSITFLKNWEKMKHYENSFYFKISIRINKRLVQ